MSFRKSRTWWSQRSLAQSIQSQTLFFSESSKIVRKELIIPEDKHTFFPGNEISRNRILNSSSYILRPDSSLKIIADFLMFIDTLFLAIIIPYSISYFYDIPKGFYYTSSLLYFFDMLLAFNTSYYNKGKLITNRKKIVRNYLKGWFYLDIISGIPSEFFITFDYSYNMPRTFYSSKDFLRLVLFLKLLKMVKINLFFSTLKELSTDSSFFAGIKVLIHIIFIIVPIHWVNCIFNVVYVYQVDTGYEYLMKIKYTNEDRYLIIFEKIMQTLTSVGYGDFLPLTPNEKLLSLILMVFTSGYFGFFIGEVEQIITNSIKVNIYFRRVKSRLMKLYDKHKINKNLRSKINAYIRHLIDTYKNHSIQDENFIKILSIPLREQIFLCTKGYVLITVSFFKPLSRPCIRSIGYKMMLRVYGPSDIIFSEGETKPEMYFINSGVIQIFHLQSETTFIDLGKDSIFGELSFLLNQGRSASAQSANFSELLCLNRFDVDKVLSKMPKDNEKFLSILWNLKKYGISYLGMTCYLCGNSDHLARNCWNFIWKPNINKRNFSAIDKKVNVEYTPKLASRYTKHPNFVYEKHNATGKGMRVDKLFKKNVYLARKADEYSRQLDFQRSNFTRVIKMMEEEERSNVQSSDESERNFLKFKYLDATPKAFYSGSSPASNSGQICF